jgi:hypothetical protein
LILEIQELQKRLKLSWKEIEQKHAVQVFKELENSTKNINHQKGIKALSCVV